jgi:hypothetical protein
MWAQSCPDIFVDGAKKSVRHRDSLGGVQFEANCSKVGCDKVKELLNATLVLAAKATVANVDYFF